MKFIEWNLSLSIEQACLLCESNMMHWNSDHQKVIQLSTKNVNGSFWKSIHYRYKYKQTSFAVVCYIFPCSSIEIVFSDIFVSFIFILQQCIPFRNNMFSILLCTIGWGIWDVSLSHNLIESIKIFYSMQKMFYYTSV